jgi:hypothetical protein
VKKKIIGILVAVAVLGIGLFAAVPALASTNPITSVQITPSTISIGAGGSQQFSAQAYDAGNQPVSNVKFFWLVVTEGGTINDSGLFVAGGVPGTYSIEVVAVQGSLTQVATATVTVTESTGILDHITVTPADVTLAPGATRQFTAQGYDINNVAITGLNYVWSVTTGAGTITGTGINTMQFTAGSNIGTFTNAIQASATQNSVNETGYANVVISTNNVPPPKLNANVLMKMFNGYLKSFGFDNFLGGQWQVKNGTAIDMIKVIPGVVQTASDTLLTIIPNGQTATSTFTLTSDTIIQPKKSALAADDKVVIVTVNDQTRLVVKITQVNTEQMPPGLRKQGDDKREGKDTPPGWSKGNKTGWNNDSNESQTELDEGED